MIMKWVPAGWAFLVDWLGLMLVQTLTLHPHPTASLLAWQAVVAMGEVGVAASDPDMAALDVLGDILNSFGGRLFDRIRSREARACRCVYLNTGLTVSAAPAPCKPLSFENMAHAASNASMCARLGFSSRRACSLTRQHVCGF